MQRDLSEVSRQEEARVSEANPLRETLERFYWTKPLSSLCGLFQSRKEKRRFETAGGQNSECRRIDKSGVERSTARSTTSPIERQIAMTCSSVSWQSGGAVIGAVVVTALAMAQSNSSSIGPLRTAPVEKFTVNPGFRDWGPATVAGTTIMAGNSSNRGGLFAVDMVSGKLKWAARPTGTGSGNPFVSTAPAVSGEIVIVPMGNTLMALSLATGKELWRGPATQQGAAVAVGAGLAFVLGADNNFYALDAATGREKWKVGFPRVGSCESAPVVRDGSVYVSRAVLVTPANEIHPASYYRYLVALDTNTGEERWRYPSAPVGTSGVCYGQPIVTADTFFGVEGPRLYAVNTANGRERWAPVEVRRPVEGRERAVPVRGLVEANSVLVGVTKNFLIAFDKATGRIVWDVPGQYRENSPSTAVAGNVLYFQGHPGASPAAEIQGTTVYVGGKPVVSAPLLPGGRLNALDLDTRAILWSFSRPTAEPNWSFGYVTPVDGGLWVDSYQALVKLQ
jgi:outer membrane protein assembly factor BamB